MSKFNKKKEDEKAWIEEICYEEIFNFLSSSSDESSIDFNIKDDIVKRPKKNGF